MRRKIPEPWAVWVYGPNRDKEVFASMADETKTNATPEAPGGPPAPEQTEQAVIPGMDGGPEAFILPQRGNVFPKHVQHPTHKASALGVQLGVKGSLHPVAERMEIALGNQTGQQDGRDRQCRANTLPPAHAEPVPSRRVERQRQSGEQQEEQSQAAGRKTANCRQGDAA